MRSSNKIIGITLGDPSGIGPEVVAKAIKKLSRSTGRFVIFGDWFIYKKHASTIPSNCHFIDFKLIARNNLKIGKINRASAQASLTYLDGAIDLLKKKDIHALVTAPVNKEAICLIKPHFHGHTEFLAEAFNVKNFGMMFVTDTLKTIIVTRHIAVNEISKTLNSRLILETINLAYTALKDQFKIKTPRIAVCGLNPHAGEGGTIGKEEITKIIPAIKQAQEKGINVSGPFAADTLFSPKNIKNFDAFVAMYHDQGLIPIKTLKFNSAVNLTVGLPFIRTSPAHGTAFDIAGKNKADESSMIEAIKLAVLLS